MQLKSCCSVSTQWSSNSEFLSFTLLVRIGEAGQQVQKKKNHYLFKRREQNRAGIRQACQLSLLAKVSTQLWIPTYLSSLQAQLLKLTVPYISWLLSQVTDPRKGLASESGHLDLFLSPMTGVFVAV